MPKAILEFQLPEERSEFETANKAGEYYSMLHDIWQYRRSLRKHEHRRAIPLDELLTTLDELLGEFDI